MKTHVIFLALVVTLLTSCNSFDTVIDDKEKICGEYEVGIGSLYLINTSQSRYLEVTVKNREGKTRIKKLKPGERRSLIVGCDEAPFTIVGEREITGNEE